MTNFWMGHTLDDTQSAYFRASAENGLKDTYLKLVSYLTIQKEAEVSEDPDYQRIKQENQILAAETARHVVERKKLHDLKEQLELERADRNEYERNVGSLIETTMAEQMSEFRKQMMDGFNESMEQFKKIRKPIDLKDE